MKRYIPVTAIALSLVFVFAYLFMQHALRSSLNHPQLEIAQDAKTRLEKGEAQPADIVGRGKLFDIRKSGDTLIAIYDESGNELESNASFGTSTLHVPEGVLLAAKQQGINMVTWQPDQTTRIALVVMPLQIESGWYVVSGRRMEDTETLITQFGIGLFILYLITLVILSLRLRNRHFNK